MWELQSDVQKVFEKSKYTYVAVAKMIQQVTAALQAQELQTDVCHIHYHDQLIFEAIRMAPTLECNFNSSIETIVVVNIFPAPEQNTAILDSNTYIRSHIAIRQTLLHAEALE